ncbi:SCP-like protein [Ancylostoma ceylanicum]|uniref:SCP-like protein n=1 Tax=Ancylostoma ceylanicum TaxID=53326 RepID=A0A0D6LFL3_9BILA|nr:SCP-like protein [Ancylostoma ceylanicum]
MLQALQDPELGVFGYDYIANCPGPALTNDQRDTLTNLHNQIRSEAVRGALPNWAGNLNAGMNIYKLKYDCALEDAAAAAMGAVCRQAMLQPPKYGQNVQAYYTNSIVALPLDDLLQDSVQQWYSPLARYGLTDANYKYTDPRLESFANMVFYKNTALGCHYAECQNPRRKVITCMYNNMITPNDFIYPKGTPCQKDADCTVYNPSTCDLTTQLCVTTVNPNPNPNPPATGMCPNAEMTDEIRNEILRMHNWRRTKLAKGNIKNGLNSYYCPKASNMYKMKYDCALENSALAYAKQCQLKPSNPQNEGENIHSASLNQNKTAAARTAVKAWWSQIFKNGINQKVLFIANLRDKPNAPTSFTQMAWAKSYKIGCAVVDCPANTFTVCRYQAKALMC